MKDYYLVRLEETQKNIEITIARHEETQKNWKFRTVESLKHEMSCNRAREDWLNKEVGDVEELAAQGVSHDSLYKTNLLGEVLLLVVANAEISDYIKEKRK